MSNDGLPDPVASPQPLPAIPSEVNPLSDEELLREIRQSAAGYRFGQLWRGHLLHHRTAAGGDLEMCRMLASWGGPDRVRIDRLFRLSGRMCDRWDERHGELTYGEITIDMVLGCWIGPGDPAFPLCRKLQLVWGDAVESRPIDWLWPDWLARGVLAVLDGDPGLGKSSVALDLVARVTTGSPLPPCAESATPACAAAEAVPLREPRRALVMALEDSLEYVVKPRLEAAGADLTRVGFVGGVVENTAHGRESYNLQLPRDLDLVANVVREYEPALLVIDPLFAVMGLDRRGRFIKASDDQSVRQLTGALKQLAEEAGLTILLIRHLAKRRRGAAVLSGSGSVAIAGQARAVLLAAEDPLEPGRRVLAMVKTNLGALPRSLRFQVVPGRSTVGEVCRVEWQGDCEMTAEDLLAPPELPREEGEEGESPAYLLAQALLLRVLADGPKTWAEIVKAGEAEGLTAGTLKVARRELRLVRSGLGPGTRWSLPTSSAGES
jgi:hypothetical protein